MLRRCSILAFAVLAMLAPSESRANTKPNVLFIAIDDLNDWIGCLGGHPQTKTPNLDRLAKKGVNFTRAYCASPCCNPSRAALLSGKRPSTSGVYNNNQPWRQAMPDVVTLPAYFMQHGYLVWGGNKIFHGSFPDTKAWHEYYTGKNKIPKKGLPMNGIGGNMEWGPIPAGDEVMNDTDMIDWAIGKLKQKHDRPFFLAPGMHKPHLSWHVPQKYFDMFPIDKIQLPKTNPSDLDDVPAGGLKMAKREGDHRAITQKGVWKNGVQAYLAAIAYMDAQIGRLIDALEKSEYANNTIVIFWSDHGWSLGEKEHWRKFALWERETRVPMFMIVPGMTKANQTCARTVNLMDLYPTLIDLCDLPKKSGLEGNSIVALLKDPTAKWDHPSLTTWLRGNHAVRSERWRYIRYIDGGEELYDHESDPHEWTNLAKDPKYAAIKKELGAYMPKSDAPDAGKSGEKAKKKKNKNKDDEAAAVWPDAVWRPLALQLDAEANLADVLREHRRKLEAAKP